MVDERLYVHSKVATFCYAISNAQQGKHWARKILSCRKCVLASCHQILNFFMNQRRADVHVRFSSC